MSLVIRIFDKPSGDFDVPHDAIPKQDAAMPLNENADTPIRRHVSPGRLLDFSTSWLLEFLN
jgi:hypothetical protein